MNQDHKNDDENNNENNTKTVILCNSTISSRILKVVNDNPTQQFNATTLDYILENNRDYRRDLKRVAKIRTSLKRLSDDGKIRRMKHGYYQAKATLEIISRLESPETKVHGIKLECRKILGISSQNNMVSWLESKHFRPIVTGDGAFLRRWTADIWWEGRIVCFTVHECELVEVFVQCADNPLSYVEFCELCRFLDGYFSPFLFCRNNVFVTQLGVNRDFESLNLEGVTCVRLHRFLNCWASVYKREDGRVRFEHHLTKLNLTLGDTLDLLGLLSSPGRVVVDGNGRVDEFRDVV